MKTATTSAEMTSSFTSEMSSTTTLTKPLHAPVQKLPQKQPVVSSHAVKLPPVGPAWAGSLMGTSITASLLNVHARNVLGGIPVWGMLIFATSLAVAITVGWIFYDLIGRRSARFSMGDMPAWAMVAMGIMALGSAYSSITGLWIIHACTWAVGSALSIVTCVRYSYGLLVKHESIPEATFAWGLPLVAPMVVATVSAQLAHHVSVVGSSSALLAGHWSALSSGLHVWGWMCFGLTWMSAVPTFAIVYFATAPRLGIQAATTAWIPLGMVGQSTAAALLLAGGASHAATVYGLGMLTLGVPMATYAFFHHWRVLLTSRRRHLAYSPTWWASTFPVGTLCLGTHVLSGSSISLDSLEAAGMSGLVNSLNLDNSVVSLSWMNTVSQGLLVLLLVHVTWSAAGGVATLVRRAREK